VHLDNHAEAKLRQESQSETTQPPTAASYEQLIRNYVTPTIGHVKLQSIDGATLNRLYGELLKSGRTSSRLGSEWPSVVVCCESGAGYGCSNGMAVTVAPISAPPISTWTRSPTTQVMESRPKPMLRSSL